MSIPPRPADPPEGGPQTGPADLAATWSALEAPPADLEGRVELVERVEADLRRRLDELDGR